MLKGFVEVGEGAFKKICSIYADYDKVDTTAYGPVKRMEFFTVDNELFGVIFFTGEGEIRVIKEHYLSFE